MRTKICNFVDLDVWKEGHKIVLKIYKITKNFPKHELYGLTSQIRRAAISITSNIAKGFSKFHYKEKIHFYYSARGSTSEVQNLLIIGKDLGYIDLVTYKELLVELDNVSKLLNGLIRSTGEQIATP